MAVSYLNSSTVHRTLKFSRNLKEGRHPFIPWLVVTLLRVFSNSKILFNISTENW